jgi:ubiquinone/menaquinone biosynthesis C-methylase UbiE
MSDTKMESVLKKQNEIINLMYTKAQIQISDFLGRDFLGVISRRGISFLADKLRLTQDSHILDLGSGLGGPARYFAKTYGCKVTGLDLSEANYEAAKKKTKEAGLDNLVDFIHGNALDIPMPDQSITHVYGCDAWCYIPDKLQLFKGVYRVLKHEGLISFLEAAHEAPRRYIFENSMGRCFFESITGYTSKLEEAGFEKVKYFNVTDLSSQDILNRLYDRISMREKIIETYGSEIYHQGFEPFAEILALYSKGDLSHCCFIAEKK